MTHEDLSSKSFKDILEYFLPVIKRMASKIKKGYPETILELDDLVNAGVLGLLNAFKNFDLSRKESFNAYARIKIKGAIRDELRSMSMVSRSIRDKQKMINVAKQELTKIKKFPPTNSELAKFLGISEEKLERILLETEEPIFFNINEPVSKANGKDRYNNEDYNLRLLHLECQENPEEKAIKIEILKIILREILKLSLEEKRIIFLFYFKGLFMREIALKSKKGKARISQIHTKAIKKIRRRLKYKNYY